MNKLILMLSLLLTLNCVSQQEPLRDVLKDEWKTYIEDGWYRLSVGVFSHTIGFNTLQYGKLSNPTVLQGFIFANGVGLTLDIMSIHSFVMARKTLKRIKLIENTPRFY